MELTVGRKWGLIGLFLLILYYGVSLVILQYISSTPTVEIIISTMSILFAFLAMYAGGMAFKNSSKVLGLLDILLGIVIVVAQLFKLFVALKSMIIGLPSL